METGKAVLIWDKPITLRIVIIGISGTRKRALVSGPAANKQKYPIPKPSNNNTGSFKPDDVSDIISQLNKYGKDPLKKLRKYS